MALPEGGFEIEAERRQADETEYGARAQPAFEAVEGVALDVDPGVGQTGVEEGGGGGSAMGHRRQGSRIGLFQYLRIDLGEDAAIGDGDGEDAGQRGQAENLQEDQGPEQLVDGADEGRQPTHRAEMKDQRQGEADDAAKGDAEEGEGHRLGERLAQLPDGEEIGGDDAERHPPHLAPRIERRYLDVGDEKADDRHADEGEGSLERARTLHLQFV